MLEPDERDIGGMLRLLDLLAPRRLEAMKRAGVLRNAVDMQGLLFTKRGGPPKT